MLKISQIDGRTHRRLVLEGKLMAPWLAELRTACEKTRADLHDRELVIDMKHITTISQEGENVLLQLMNEGVKFRCGEVFGKCVLRQVARRASRNHQEAKR